MKRQRFSTRSTEGFTLLEMLVVIIMIGVMFAIAAPSWVAFLNNQRVNTARNQVFETLRAAQSEAKRTKINRAVVFDNNSNMPRMATIPVLGDSIDTPTKSAVQNWQTLGNGEIKPGTIKVNSVPAPASQVFDASVLFDTYGNVIKTNNTALDTANGYKIVVGVVSSTNPRRCIAIKTLLGAAQESADADCQ